MKAALPRLFAEPGPHRVLEKDGRTLRSVYGCHATDPVFGRVVRHPKILEPGRQLLGSEVYVYQFKINAKAGLGGDVWEWHQDYVFWQREDGLPRPCAVNATVFLDDVNELNGPMFVLPGSQREGVVDPAAHTMADGGAGAALEAYRDRPAWISNLTVNLKYALEREVVASLFTRYGVTAPMGPAGSVLFFHPNLVHGSPSNISPFDRTFVIVTYNSTANLPTFPGERRPEFLVSSDFAALTPVAESSLLTP